MATQATNPTSTDWWTALWNAIAGAIGWVNNAIGVNQCTGPNEYYDANQQKCVAIPQCGTGTYLDTTTMTCVPLVGEGPSLTTWIIIVAAIVVIFVVIILLMRKR